MFKMVTSWYRERFSDPHASTLMLMLILLALMLYFFGPLFAPIIVALSVAYLLEWPTAQLNGLGVSRRLSATIVVACFVGLAFFVLIGAVPVLWSQLTALVQELPQMLTKGQALLLTLPEKYPEFVSFEQIDELSTELKHNAVQFAQDALQVGLSSIGNLVALLIYSILVPLMVFFFLSDKDELYRGISRFFPTERRLISRVSIEMNQQIMNYIRGKVMEVVIIGLVSFVTFWFLDLRYAALLGLLVGLSVLVPFVGATVVTFPVFLVGLFQFGLGPELGYVMIAYGIIQALDGNLLVPLLFSGAVNLHPVYIILAVIIFGGLFGFWGVFFAIPMASLCRAVVNAVTQNEEPIEEKS